MRTYKLKSLSLLVLLALTTPISLFAEEKFNPPVTYSNPPLQNQQNNLNAKITSNLPTDIKSINKVDLSELNGANLIDPGNMGNQSDQQPQAESRCPLVPQNGYEQFSLYGKNFVNLRTQEARTISAIHITSVLTNLRPMQFQQAITIRDTQGCEYLFSSQDHATVLQQFESLKAAASDTNRNTLFNIGVNSCNNNGCLAELVSGSVSVHIPE